MIELQRTAGNQAVVQRLSGALLRQGSSGPEVRRLQEALNARGANLDPDGIFGRMTRAAVVSFQRANGLSPDGVVGPKTWGVLGSGHGKTADPLVALKLAEVKRLLAIVKPGQTAAPTRLPNAGVNYAPWARDGGEDEESEEETSLWDDVTGFVGDTVEAIGNTVAGAVDTASETVAGVVDAVGDTVSDAVDTVTGAVAGAGEAIGSTFGEVVNGVDGVVTQVTGAVSEAAGEVLGEMQAVGSEVGAFLGEVWTTLESLLPTPDSPALLPAIQAVIDKLTAIINGSDPESEEGGVLADITMQGSAAEDSGTGSFAYNQGTTSEGGFEDKGARFGAAMPVFKLSGLSWKRSNRVVQVTGTATCDPKWFARARDNQKDVSSADDPKVTRSTWKDIVADLHTDSAGEPPRKEYWSRAATVFHEGVHCSDYIKWADRETHRLGLSLEQASITIRPGIWNAAANSVEVAKALDAAVGEWAAGTKRHYLTSGEQPVYAATKPKYDGIVSAIKARAKKERW